MALDPQEGHHERRGGGDPAQASAVALAYPDPELTGAVLDALRVAWPAWVISRGSDLLWRARHVSWPADVGLAHPGARTLDQLIAAVADVADTRAGSDPICLGCGEELSISPEGWRSADGSLTCTVGRRAGERHTTTLAGSR